MQKNETKVTNQSELVYQSEKGNAITDSLKVAKRFGKRHDNVLQSIDNLISELKDKISLLTFEESELGEINAPKSRAVEIEKIERAKKALKSFHETTYKNSRNKTLRMFLMTKHGFTVLVQKLTGEKALDFQLEFIEAFEIMDQKLKSITFATNSQHIADHQKRDTQIQNSKSVNSKIWIDGGTSYDIANYHREHCEKITGKTPSELKEIAKQKKIPSKNRTSGKEVVRQFWPEKACRMSVDDQLFRSGVPLDKAIEVTEPLEKYFSNLLSIGITPPELNA